MITRLGMAPRRPGMTTSQVLEHWRTSHADAAGQIPGLRRYDQLHPVLVDGGYPLGYPGFDACSELDFDSVEEMEAGFGSQVYQQAVRADEDAFIDKQRFSLVLGTWHDLDGQADASAPRLLRMLRVHPAADADVLWSAVTGPYLAAVAGDERIAGVRVLRPLEEQRGGREQPACDLVVDLAVADADAALAWARSEAAVDVDLTLAGLVFGSVSHLVQPLRVVG